MIPVEILENALGKVKEYFAEIEAKIPEQHKGKVSFLSKAEKDFITLFEVRPAFGHPGEFVNCGFARLRYVRKRSCGGCIGVGRAASLSSMTRIGPTGRQ